MANHHIEPTRVLHDRTVRVRDSITAECLTMSPNIGHGRQSMSKRRHLRPTQSPEKWTRSSPKHLVGKPASNIMHPFSVSPHKHLCNHLLSLDSNSNEGKQMTNPKLPPKLTNTSYHIPTTDRTSINKQYAHFELNIDNKCHGSGNKEQKNREENDKGFNSKNTEDIDEQNDETVVFSDLDDDSIEEAVQFSDFDEEVQNDDVSTTFINLSD